MDAAARELLDACAPHVPTALLAHLYRLGEPFPEQAEPRPERDLAWILGQVTCLGCELHGDGYLRFWCDDCHSVMFQPFTDRGVAHGLRVDGSHKPDCCAERKIRYEATGVPPVWPDRLDE